MKDTRNLLLEIIRAVVCGGTPPDVSSLGAEDIGALLELAVAQDMAHIVGFFIRDKELREECAEVKKAFSKQYLTAIYRYQHLTYEYKRICAALEKNKVKYLPLKGSVIRAYYPEAWMRTSCDIDVLVEEAELKSAREVIVRELGYTANPKRGYHDISLYSASGVHLELHFNIRENIDPMDEILDTVWANSYLFEGKYGFRQTSEFLMFHQIAHAAYHFTRGGCGLRPLLDIWFLKKKLTLDDEKYEKLLCGAELMRFRDAVYALGDVWYSGQNHSELTREMEDFILGAGIYGSTENRVAVSRGAEKGRASYILSRLFMPYSSMKSRFPILKKYPVLLPFCHVVRWFGLLLPERRKNARRELAHNAALDSEKGERVGKMLSDIGLK